MDDPSGGEGGRTTTPPRLWTPEEANARLDRLRELLPQLRSWVVRLGKVHEELDRLRGFWGREANAPDNPDRDLKLRLEDEWKRLGHRLEREVLELKSEGIELKDLESGLVDFYSVRDGEIVFLCWQRGEAEVGYWHSLAGSFRTRKPIEARPRATPLGRTTRLG